MQLTHFNVSGVFSRMRTRMGRLAAAVMLCGAATVATRGATPGFSVSESVSAGEGMNSLRRAGDLLAGRVASESSQTGNYAVINFKTPHENGRMHFPGWLPFPVAEPRNDHNFAMHITGEVEIPEAGEWTFGVRSNGGFHLQIGADSIQRTAFRGGSNTFSTLDFQEAGTFPVDLTYYEHAARATLELFASPGRFHRFASHGADWHLVGDSADGGLSIMAESALVPAVGGDSLGTPDVSSPGDITVTASDTVPEPGSLLIAGVAAPWLLGRRWRRRLN